MRIFEMTRNGRDHFVYLTKEMTLMKRNYIWILTSLMLGGLIGLTSMSLAAENPWTRKADMPVARATHSSSVVNGKIYVIGGSGDVGVSAVAEYDPATDTWRQRADMLTAVNWITTSVANGKIYAIGGYGNKALSVVEEYDPSLD